MKRSDYLNTSKGQAHEWYKRHFKKIYLTIDQEPQSKNSLSDIEKQRFRAEVKRQLAESNRRAYRGDIILEIDFYTTKNNPPAIHTLVKNYLDLLHKEMPHLDKFSQLLFRDDSQVKVLIANYHLNIHRSHKPHISITCYSMSDFIIDVALAERIRRNEFTDINEWDRRKNSHTRIDEVRDTNLFFDLRKELDDILGKESNIVSKFGRTTFDLLAHFHTRRLQEQYLKDNKIDITDLSHVFQRRFSQNKKYIDDSEFQKIWDIVSNYISFGLDFLEVGSVPRKTGDRQVFRSSLQAKLTSFKEKHKTLFPLLQPIGLTVIFIPSEDLPADLDNLARDLVPFIHEIFQPPVKHKNPITGLQGQEIVLKEAELLQKLPKYSITTYQIISVPRKKNDPVNGKIDLIITDGMLPKSNVWTAVDQFIQQWEKVL